MKDINKKKAPENTQELLSFCVNANDILSFEQRQLGAFEYLFKDPNNELLKLTEPIAKKYHIISANLLSAYLSKRSDVEEMEEFAKIFDLIDDIKVIYNLLKEEKVFLNPQTE